MKKFCYMVTVGAFLAIAILSGTACAANTKGAIDGNVDDLLRRAHIFADYWHKGVSDGGVTNGAHLWLVDAYQYPKLENGTICVTSGKTWLLRESINSQSDGVSIQETEDTTTMYLLNVPKKCQAISSDEYFLVEPSTMRPSEVTSLLENIDDAKHCADRSGAACAGWNRISIDSNGAAEQLRLLDSMLPFLVQAQNDGSIKVTYRYPVMDHNKDFLVFTVRKQIDHTDSLEVATAPFEAEPFRKEKGSS